MTYPAHEFDLNATNGILERLSVDYCGVRCPVLFWGNVEGGSPAVLLRNGIPGLSEHVFWVLPHQCTNPKISDVPPFPLNESRLFNKNCRDSLEYWINPVHGQKRNLKVADRKALIAAIRAHRDENTPRLLYADWLAEFSQEPRDIATASYIRATCSPGSRSPVGAKWLESSARTVVNWEEVPHEGEKSSHANFWNAPAWEIICSRQPPCGFFMSTRRRKGKAIYVVGGIVHTNHDPTVAMQNDGYHGMNLRLHFCRGFLERLQYRIRAANDSPRPDADYRTYLSSRFHASDHPLLDLIEDF